MPVQTCQVQAGIVQVDIIVYNQQAFLILTYMNILHVSAECYPAAKVGGLADVVGAIPKYQVSNRHAADVIMPKFGTPWFKLQKYKEIYSRTFWYPGETITFSIQEVTSYDFGFKLYVVDIPGKFDRDGIYADSNGYFHDDSARWLSFQRSVLNWVFNTNKPYDLLHVHDHHTALIPFMLNHCYDYSSSHHIKTVFTIHNLAYQGAFGWDQQYLLPAFDNWQSGLLDWDHQINPIASAIRCADHVTTVSPSYLEELKTNSYGLEWLFETESHKCTGILNGIDHTVWNPKTDTYLNHLLDDDIFSFKLKNKTDLCDSFTIDPSKCTISFIGRMVEQKGADMLAYAMHSLLSDYDDINFIILGTGDPYLEDQFELIKKSYPTQTGISLAYDEQLAHQIYASSDFLIMPSRHEPCGLNQMYAMRYGTSPIVNNTGGLIDSVLDYKKKNGTGIKIESLNVQDIIKSIEEAIELYQNSFIFKQTVINCQKSNFSWEASSKKYIDIYESLINRA